jgi:phosphatidylserine/phosphatidylglycerophosphate/cardiolipin synthase-like enzyme
MLKIFRATLFLILSIGALTTQANIFPGTTSYSVCFTPGQNCTQEVVDLINSAQKTLLIQAYGFTSAPILKAVVEAHNQGVDVRVILDKSQYSKEGKYRSSTYLLNNGVPVWIDNKVTIAHNKVMVIDNRTIITGSFNFTQSAQKRNAENLLIIEDEGLAQAYAENWGKRATAAIELD